MNEKLKVVKKKIEEVEEGNRDLSTNIEKINLNIKSEEIKEYEYDSINLRMSFFFFFIFNYFFFIGKMN